MKSLFSQEDAMKEYGDEQKIRGAIAAWKDVGLSEEEIIKRATAKFNVTEDYVRSLLHTAA